MKTYKVTIELVLINEPKLPLEAMRYIVGRLVNHNDVTSKVTVTEGVSIMKGDADHNCFVITSVMDASNMSMQYFFQRLHALVAELRSTFPHGSEITGTWQEVDTLEFPA